MKLPGLLPAVIALLAMFAAALAPAPTAAEAGTRLGVAAAFSMSLACYVAVLEVAGRKPQS